MGLEVDVGKVDGWSAGYAVEGVFSKNSEGITLPARIPLFQVKSVVEQMIDCWEFLQISFRLHFRCSGIIIITIIFEVVVVGRQDEHLSREFQFFEWQWLMEKIYHSSHPAVEGDDWPEQVRVVYDEYANAYGYEYWYEYADGTPDAYKMLPATPLTTQ